MKTLNVILVSMILVVTLSISAESNVHAMGGCQDGEMMGMMDSPESRSMMMDEIVADPEMRHQMMQKMMQAMMDSDGMDQAKMKEMMENPEMMEMMKKHMMSVQMMNGGMMGEHSKEDSEEHVH